MSRTDAHTPHHVMLIHSNTVNHNHSLGECIVADPKQGARARWTRLKCKRVVRVKVVGKHKPNRPGMCLRDGVWVPQDLFCCSDGYSTRIEWTCEPFPSNTRTHVSFRYEPDESISCSCDDCTGQTQPSCFHDLDSKGRHDMDFWGWKAHREDRRIDRKRKRAKERAALYRARFDEDAAAGLDQRDPRDLAWNHW